MPLLSVLWADTWNCRSASREKPLCVNKKTLQPKGDKAGQSDRRRRGGKRVPCGHLREAQSDPQRGSETMSATGREARMIEQPGCRGPIRGKPGPFTATEGRKASCAESQRNTQQRKSLPTEGRHSMPERPKAGEGPCREGAESQNQGQESRDSLL